MTLLNVAVIVVAAGSGSRFGYKRNKLFFPLWGKPVLQHTLSHVFQATLVTEVIIVYAECDYADIKKMVHELHPRQIVRYVLGGIEREDSVYQGYWQRAKQWISLWFMMVQDRWLVPNILIEPCL